MKFRVRDNSLRLRLSKSEVEAFGSTGRYSACTVFPNGMNLSYSLVRDEHAEQLAAQFEGATVTVVVPATMAENWVESDAVGMSGSIPTGGGGTLDILVEKDFQCLTARPGEDEVDMYPHPGECTGHGHRAAKA